MSESKDSGVMSCDAVFNHIVLPPQLPNTEDGDVDAVSTALINLVSSAVQDVRKLTHDRCHDQLYYVHQSLVNHQKVSISGAINKQILLQQLRSLEDKHQIILHVTKQNAALLIRRERNSSADNIIFEAFEASPTSQKALEAKSALQWDFPGIAVSVPYSTFIVVEFQEELATFLEQASKESIKRFAATTNKAASGAWESRDTVDPKLITGLMMSLLEATGTRIFPPLLRKRVRDDVCWFDGLNPWRRNPTWLILRVAVERHLQQLFNPEEGRIQYKLLKCWLLQDLLKTTFRQIHPERSMLLQAKLCRRIAKLERERLLASGSLQSSYSYFLEKLRPVVCDTVRLVDGNIKETWGHYCQHIERRITTLPRRADSHDTTLTLPSSGGYLDSILADSTASTMTHQIISTSSQGKEIPQDGRKIFAAFADRHYKFLAVDANLTQLIINFDQSEAISIKEKCIKLSTQLLKYLEAVGNLYNGVPEAFSRCILQILETWVSLDQYAGTLYPLLKDFHPVLTAEMLTSLHIESAQEFIRLQKLDEYLRRRTQESQYKTSIFADPSKGCFADQYVAYSTESGRFEELRQHIESTAEANRGLKEAEWKTKTAEFEKITQEILAIDCQLQLSDDYPPVQHHDMKRCKKCFLERKARRMRITIHEHPLPESVPQMRAVLFELLCPQAFASYRDVTWKIISTLTLPGLHPASEPRLILQNYSGLAGFGVRPQTAVTLGSTKKSFLQTHFAEISLPTPLENVCVSNGLFLTYYDTVQTLWPGRLTLSPTLFHHFPYPIPESSPFAPYVQEIDPKHPPSSYEVVASQTLCPTGANIHEFLGYQSLLGGYHRRLPSILLELASSNLNFSSETISSIVRYLIHQAGPSHGSESLRRAHGWYQDTSFASQLLDQISNRLELISSNWREVHCMEMLINLLTRSIDIWIKFGTDGGILSRGLKLLDDIRAVISTWLSNLRDEVNNTENAQSSCRFSEFALWAALLGRSTYSIHGRHPRKVLFDWNQVEIYIKCSIMLQHHLFVNPSLLPASLNKLLVKDIRIAYRIAPLLATAIANHPTALPAALALAWPQDEDTKYEPAEFLPQPYQWWIRIELAGTRKKKSQTVLFHYVEGHLLLNGKPLGQLPPEHRISPVIKELFGAQNLLTGPSRLPGMTYMLCRQIDRHRVHIGFRGRSLVIRAEIRGSLLEYIPREVFKDQQGQEDLPASLMDGCFHWLDLVRGNLYIRKTCWREKTSDWTINLYQREAKRREVKLVDRFSPLFKKIAAIFSKFEAERHLTVFQPRVRPLSVELRRLELRWEVNNQGYLESEALQAYVDSNQDAGTWYGLRSKIVLHDTVGDNRSVLIPLNTPRCRQNGPHVEIEIINKGVYGQYYINEILGRIDCPPEPLLLFTKALIHAYTSFVLPDPLTGRTGTEEALHCLQSGYCQPWSPLNPRHYPLLESLANLTPFREYYPEELKVMQKVTWDPRLRSYTQHEHFFTLTRKIISKSDQLQLFSKDRTESLSLDRGHPDLFNRAKIRRSLYERDSNNYLVEMPDDVVYHSRGYVAGYTGRQNVYEVAYHLHNWNQNLILPHDIATILEKWPTIGGFEGVFEKALLSDKLDIEMPLFWGSLVRQCQLATKADRYKLIFIIATIVYNNHTVDMEAIRLLVAFATNPDLKACKLPPGATFTSFRRNPSFKTEALQQLIKPYCKVYSKSELQNGTGFALHGKYRKRLEAMEKSFDLSVEEECDKLIKNLIAQWPCSQPSITITIADNLIDIDQALLIIQPEWSRLFFNLQLSSHVDEVQKILQDCRNIPAAAPEPNNKKQKGPSKISRIDTRVSLHDFLRARGLKASNKLLASFILAKRKTSLSTKKTDLVTVLSTLPHASEIKELEGIVAEISQTSSIVRQRYANDLRQSILSFKEASRIRVSQQSSPLISDPASRVENARARTTWLLEGIQRGMEEAEPYFFWLKLGNLLPCTTKVSLLETIRSCNNIPFGPGMKESLVLLGVTITDLQQLLRIGISRLKKDIQRTEEEERNPGHQNWEPMQFPDWLLLEIDSNLLLRPEQIEVAHATINPASAENSVLQMNMGQGKTSCIMPMAASSLADSKRLVRIVVPRALILQTVQMIHARLGGLVGREVRHVPFSRKTSTSPETIKVFHNIHLHILKSSGLMVSLPEHTLSFMLSGLQRLSDGLLDEARPMIRAQDWLNKFSRDILDESDFTLAVRTQLIYPSGSQKVFDGHPNRWKSAEALLALVETYLHNIRTLYPRSIEVVQRPGGGYPFIYFLRRDAEDNLIKRLIHDICTGRTSILPLVDYHTTVQQYVKQFISDPKLPLDLVDEIRRTFNGKTSMLKTIYLLRGLFVHRILLLSLKKRWNVQYGLHPTRDPVAVPYHAKGVPSEQAEWGHPDVAILFTCLSFYYQGLSIHQLSQSLRFVLQSDDPASEYDRWIQNAESLPGSLHEWNSINIDDEAQLKEIWDHVRYKVVVIDHYLNNFVFPSHAKQFLTKLQASGWDIPLFAASDNGPNRYGRGITTGFSGTNDNKTMLPLTIKQEDLPTLSHTNAEVLTYLLQPRNREYVLTAKTRGHRWTEEELLVNLKEKEIRVLIDAGAQILEMDNLQLVTTWMKIDYKAAAAIYFNEFNKPFVLYRNGNRVPLLATPYAEDSADCLVYLDESHTRGTDLKMPSNAKGALTLGLGQTKDHTVQAAMRLRQLGTTQSVMFFAPPEVHQSIIDVQHKSFYSPINSHDVVTWLLHQTCAGIEQLQPLYFSQGLDFCRRFQAAHDNPQFLEDPDHLEEYLNILRQPEQQTLKQMYEPKQAQKTNDSIANPVPEIAKFMEDLKTRRRGFQDTGEAVHGSALQEVEQEREVAFEVESVREVQKPLHYTPYNFPGLHKDLVTFVHTGRAIFNVGGYEPAFQAIRRTISIGEKYQIDLNLPPSSLYSSTEFRKTVHIHSGRFSDNFQRPVSWILLSCSTNIAIIVTPEEAEYLIPHLNSKSRQDSVHLVCYAAPITRKMVQFEGLQFFGIPSLDKTWTPPRMLSVEIGIIAGGLYFSYEHSKALRLYLGLNGAEESPYGEKAQCPVIFNGKPLSFLHEWLTLKRKGQDFLHTPMGYLCQSRALSQTHPFFRECDIRTLPVPNHDDSERKNTPGITPASDDHESGEHPYESD
ncbi:hypothetical protein H072_4291 [Dactylellina haptotyla CBS 200.50]|uniref:ubiquitinyl hydrolase 1 n=1 Tax=Dactylellina haptotyla (strain CBS 200.50) TaxID=1284197 RepID=S8AKZ8_DACHA|nr:hypothetical protein H072_4291 [Dactylellina haptotyla CBS 200.50]